ncbi:hypothetical protein H6G74_30670 [Nostoc spongiaeforme FACHB-130]|uniref:Uncharacterized protein n=1 Tax=Nostoc spongiaeforme FACHB-130 TaxID=1357510 RepID=A0ABR8G648_9NOSO|nr:hypothetical protein [Nostoc spongiaeforme]MBD2598629.1 hypothetical protein [Nostoc spongiaeforme FACHB-130]
MRLSAGLFAESGCTLNLVLYSEDLEVDGTVQYSHEENVWVAVIDWDNIRG